MKQRQTFIGVSVKNIHGLTKTYITNSASDGLTRRKYIFQGAILHALNVKIKAE